MPETPEKFFLTTPIYYVNARPHIGHAYTTIVADVLARRHRLLGHDTYFLTGTDEHGQKIERSALAAGVPPQQFADEVSASFQMLWKRMGITNDDFIRTTEPRHQRGAQKLFAELYERGFISLQSYTGQYCVSEEMFVEGPPGTIGPDGRPTETVTEENFFFHLSQFQLPLLNLIESDTLKITPESRKNEVLSFLRGNVTGVTAVPQTSTVPAVIDTKAVISTEASQLNREAERNSADVLQLSGPDPFDANRQDSRISSLPVPDLSPKLAHSAAGHPYVPGALRDLSVSRSSFTWGIPVPEPAASQAKEKHVIYVWLDALANYMTALGYGSDDDTLWKKYWPADLHLVGKEIIRFHCVYWPAFLLAAGLPIPKAVTAHGWLLFDDSKMSKSKGNIVRTETILDAFGTLCLPPAHTPATNADEAAASTSNDALLKGTALAVPSASSGDAALAAEVRSPSPHDRDLFAADVLRYFLLREIPFGQDGSFSFDAIVTRYNADLANGYGNLVSRTIRMINQFLGGNIPQESMEMDQSLSLFPANYIANFAFEQGGFSFSRALEEIVRFIGRLDSYISTSAPWKLAKLDDDESKHRLRVVLYSAIEGVRVATVQLYPYIPYTAEKVCKYLGFTGIVAAENATHPNLKLGFTDAERDLAPIFPRAAKGLAQIMADMEQAAQQNRAQRKLEDSPITHTTAQADAVTSRHSEFPEAPISAPLAEDPTDPAAAPRTASLPEINPGSHVAASAAITTERAASPSHTEVQASGIFAHQPPAGPQDASPQITIDDFAKVELRVAQIVVAERIPKADKLLRLEVDLGYERRQILSGIAEWYTPEDLLGRRIVIITNLAPRKMRGLDSHGMLLAASGPDGGKPALATFAGSDELPLGSRLK